MSNSLFLSLHAFGTSPRFWKELRALWKSAAATVAATWVATFLCNPPSGSALQHPSDTLTVAVCIYLCGCAMISSLAFGHEFMFATDSMLLAQPVKRSTIWREKMTALCIMIVATWSGLAPIMPLMGLYGLWIFIAPWFLVGMVPWLTIKTRNFIAGGVFSLLIPLLFLLITDSTLNQFIPTSLLESPGFFPRGRDFIFYSLSTLFLGGMMLVGLWRGYCCFVRLTVCPPRWPTLRLGLSSRTPVRELDGESIRVEGLKTRPIWLHLFGKEIRLHSHSFWLVISQVVSGIVFAMVKHFEDVFLTTNPHTPLNEGILVAILVITSLCAAILIGSSSIAEERSLGTHDWHRTLPYPTFLQYLAKFLMAFAVFAVTAWLVPLLVCNGVGMITKSTFWDQVRSYDTLAPGAFLLVVFVYGFHASALRTVPLQAMILCIAMGTMTVMIPGVIGYTLEYFFNYAVFSFGRWEGSLSPYDIANIFLAPGFTDADLRSFTLKLGLGLTIAFLAFTSSLSYPFYRRHSKSPIFAKASIVFVCISGYFYFNYIVALLNAVS